MATEPLKGRMTKRKTAANNIIDQRSYQIAAVLLTAKFTLIAIVAAVSMMLD